MDSFMRQAFFAVCEKAVETDTWFVCLIENCPFYGGPEEGGWWGADQIVVGYQEFPSEELASMAANRVRELAAELTAQSLREYGDHCLQTMEWLEARGLDADFLREPDGESEFYVLVQQSVPQNVFGDRHYS